MVWRGCVILLSLFSCTIQISLAVLNWQEKVIQIEVEKKKLDQPSKFYQDAPTGKRYQ